MSELKTMSPEALRKFRKDIDAAILNLEDRRRQAALTAAREAAAKAGFTLSELIGSKNSRKAPSPAKYRNPDNPAQTWSGRGRRPTWYKSYVASGKSPKDLLI